MGLKAERKHDASFRTPKRKHAKATRRVRRAKTPPRKIYYITPPTPEEIKRAAGILADLNARGIIRTIHPVGTLEERLKRFDRLLEGDPNEHRESLRILRKGLKESGGVRI